MMTKTLSPRIVRTLVPNTHCLQLAVNTVISEYSIRQFDFPLRPRSDDYLADVGQVGTEIVRQVSKIAGCESISIKPYGIHVVIGAAFDPEDEIVGQIVDILKDCFAEARENVTFLTIDQNGAVVQSAPAEATS